MSFCRAASSPVTSSATMLRCLRNHAAHPCRRTFATYGSFRSSPKRDMQTATAYQPHTLSSNFPMPPSDGALGTNVASNASPAPPIPGSSSEPKPEQPSASSNTGPKETEAQKSKPAGSTAPASKPEQKPRRKLRARKAAIKLTPVAVERLQALSSEPDPRMIRVGTKNKGCSGLTYHLEYVDKPGTFDEVIEQDGVKLLIDSKALFSIIGSEMDWQEDHLNQKFTFKNPNIKEQCGCGESFMV